MSQITAELEITVKAKNIEVKLTLCNKGKDNYFLSKRAQLSKKDNWLNTISVTRDGENANYIGIRLKLLEEKYPSDYFELKPDECKTSTTILNQYYDLSKLGEYEAHYRFFNTNHKTDELDVICSDTKLFTVK